MQSTPGGQPPLSVSAQHGRRRLLKHKKLKLSHAVVIILFSGPATIPTMARGRNSHPGGRGGALLACDRAIEKSEEHKQSVKKLQARGLMIADVIKPDSDIAEVLKASSSDNDNKAEEFLSTAYARLKVLAEGNAKRTYDIEDFVDAVKVVRAEVQQTLAAAGQNNEATTTTTTTEAPDYERSIHDALERVRQDRANAPSRLPHEDHAMSLEMREALGEKLPKKRSRSSRGGAADDDEDDLEIVQSRVDDVHTLKCPITGMFFVNPVKNKVCNHVYDRAGLDQLIRAKKHTCPVPGCANRSLSLAQVEEDEQMKLKVKRHKAREEAEKRKKDLEDDDDDENVLD